MAEFFKQKRGWAIRFMHEGERVYKGGFKTKQEAQRFEAEYLKEREELKNIDTNITVKRVCELFFDNYACTNTEPKTQKRYKELILNHIIPEIGDIKAVDLTPLMIVDFYKRLSEPPYSLSNCTIRKDHNVLNEAFNCCIKWQLIKFNPCTAIDPPRPEYKEMNVLTEDELTEVLSYLKGTPLYIPVLLASSTGMRVGEVAGLQENDVDLKNRKIYVRNQLSYMKGEYKLTKTKTSRSARPIAILEETLFDLFEYNKQKKRDQIEYGHRYNFNNFYCKWPDGHNITNTYMTKAFRREAKKLGYDVRFHDLRHTHATILFKHKVHPKIVSERLGHSKIQITLDLYTHLIPGLQEETLSELNLQAFGRKDLAATLFLDEKNDRCQKIVKSQRSLLSKNEI